MDKFRGARGPAREVLSAGPMASALPARSGTFAKLQQLSVTSLHRLSPLDNGKWLQLSRSALGLRVSLPIHAAGDDNSSDCEEQVQANHVSTQVLRGA